MIESIAFETHGRSRELVVVLHGLGRSRKAMEGVLAAIRAEKSDADIYCPDLAYGGASGVFSRVPIEATVNEVMAAIQNHWDERQNRAASHGGSPRYEKIS